MPSGIMLVQQNSRASPDRFSELDVNTIMKTYAEYLESLLSEIGREFIQNNLRIIAA